MISVIVTTHDKRKDLLKRALQSILGQTFEDFEVIVVDDASKDGTYEMMTDGTWDSRIKYYRRKKNFGCDTKPKNEGIMYSTGEYIAFLDSDNTYRPDHLAILHKAITSENVDVVYGDRMVVELETGNQLGLGISSDFDMYYLMRRNYIDTSDVLVKREALYYVGGFDEKVAKFIDWNMWVRIAKAGFKFKHVPFVITNYYVHKDMKSALHPSMEMTFSPVECTIQLEYLGNKVREPRVAIFSLTYDRLELTKECFESLYATAGYNLDHFIVDNGSKDGTVGYLENELNNTCGKTHLIINGDNKGISIASNQAIKEIKSRNEYDIIVKVDNDAFFKSEGWLKKMVEIWKLAHTMALSCYISGLRDNPGGAPREEYTKLAGELIGLTRHLGGICHFVDARAYKGFEWDEGETLHGVQDVEFSQWLGMHGYVNGYLENFYCEHKYGTEGQHKRFPEYFERRKYEKTHGYKKD